MKILFRSFFILFVSMFMSSCEKTIMEDNGVVEGSDSMLRISTRGTSEDVVVSYPVNIYIFQNSVCKQLVTLESADNGLAVNLKGGQYDLYAIAGATSENYTLPTVDDATPSSVVTLNSDKKHADLMTSHASIELSATNNTVELVMARKVLMMQNITINSVPDDVTAVSVAITPIYQNLLIDGTYNGDGGNHTFMLEKDASTSTWKASPSEYLLASFANVSITTTFTNATGSQSYTYNTNGMFESNYKINITGTYIAPDINLTGTIVGVQWTATKDVEFDFGEGVENGGIQEEDEVTPNEPSGDNENTVSGEVPAVGDLYQGCYVLRTETSGSNTVVTLMSPKQLNALVFEDTEQSTIENVVNAGLAELSVDGITGWRLLNMAELTTEMYTLLEDARVGINNKYLGKIDKLFISGSLYYFNDNGVIKLFDIETGEMSEKFVSEKNSHYLRAFTTITFVTN